MIYRPGSVMTDGTAGPLMRTMKACLSCADILRGHRLLGMSSCGTISILLHCLTDLLTLGLGLSVGGRDK